MNIRMKTIHGKPTSAELFNVCCPKDLYERTHDEAFLGCRTSLLLSQHVCNTCRQCSDIHILTGLTTLYLACNQVVKLHDIALV